MDFKTIFLDHFEKCLADEADIDISIMRNMASGNESSANSTLKELMQEGIVASIPEATLADMDAPLEKLKKLKLTEFGINYLNNRNKTQHSAKILADLSAKTTNIPPATINTTMQAAKWQDYVKNVAELSAKVSKISPDTINTAMQAAKWQDYVKNVAELSAKVSKISPATINTAKQAAKWQDYVKNVAELSAKVSKISPDTINTAKQAAKWQDYVKNVAELSAKVSKISPDTINTAKQAAKWQDYVKNVAELSAKVSKISPATINTAKQATKLQNMTKELCSLLDIYKSFFTDYPPEIIGSDEALNELSASIPHANTLAPGMHNLFTLEQIQQINATYTTIGDIATKLYGEKSPRALSKFLRDIENEKIKIPQEEKTPKNVDKDIKTFTFEGILGQNCGNVVDPSPEDEKRIQVKGFKVNDGLRVLRGFAKSSDLAVISQADENYQRDKYPEHVTALSDFIKKIKTSAKYLPEVTLVSRGYEKLDRVTLSGKLSPTQQGELDNLEYFRLTVNKKQLYRVDGNHRLEALQVSNYYIPFAIIIWEESKVNQDDEAFLFYFLNAKAKRLTTEENLKGLLQATTWSDGELKEANLYIPHLKFLQKILDDPFLEHKFSKDDNPIKSIAELLEKLHEDNEPIDLDCFKSAASIMKQLLQNDEWIALRKFHFYHKLLFYVAFKTGNFEKTKNVLGNLENWVSKYQFGNETFDDPISLYNNAERTNHLNPINVFVAMPYYDEGSIDDFNDQIETLKKELIEKYPVLSNRLNFYEIMRHRGYEIDIQQQIMDQIKSSHIFIADISTHECEKSGKRMNSHANPNVMYELGFAKNQPHTEIILLKNQNDEIDVPSDLITKYHNKYEKDKKYLMRKKLFEAIEGILKEKFDII